MTAHSSGDGASWNETLDVDQPHGLDYQEFNDFKIGVRKRLNSGHTTFADNTVGGIHMPGGAGILGMEITDAGGDITAPIISDGTFQGRGMVWGYDGSQDARLWCSTADAESTAATDFTLLLMHPDKQWAGGDVTWAGAHEFDASVDMTGPLSIDGAIDCSVLVVDGSADISGALDCSVLFVEQSADFSDAGFVGDVTITGVLKVDGTASAWGGTEGIGLFYDPTSYTAAADTQSTTLGNGFIMKMGKSTDDPSDKTPIVFTVAFPNDLVTLSLTGFKADDAAGDSVGDITSSKTGFTPDSAAGTWEGYNWVAIGR